MTTIPKYMRPLVKAVVAHADKAGDGHPGWAAIHDNWDRYEIACQLAREGVRDAQAAIPVMQKIADEIVANHAAMRAA